MGINGVFQRPITSNVEKKVVKMIHLVVVAFLGAAFSEQAISKLANGTPDGQKRRPFARNLAILIFDGVQIIDYTGPYETFGQVIVKNRPLFNIYTVAEKSASITTSMGMSVNPTYTFHTAPPPDMILIPGGDVRKQVSDPKVIKWIQDKSKNAEVTMSVCNGAFILAKAGLLNGHEATTVADQISGLREAAPKAKVVDNKRYVDSGRIVTTAGLSSGIDGSLHIIERFFGKGTAQMVALGMEYNWDPASHFVRAALADKYMRFNYNVKFLEGGWKPLIKEGDTTHWENRWDVMTNTTGSELLESVNETITSNKRYGEPWGSKWVRLSPEYDGMQSQSLWRFTDDNGGTWNGVVSVEPVSGETDRFTLSVKIARAALGTSTGS
jgi:putative intracellular protease/amidase